MKRILMSCMLLLGIQSVDAQVAKVALSHKGNLTTQDVLSGSLYTRQFLNTDWQSLYVPFTLNYSDWSDMFDVASFSRF